MVFQDYALFPHLTVAAQRRRSASARRPTRRSARARRGDARRSSASAARPTTYPHELSGGQQQRVALARALAPEPDLLLLDEPFSNLDVDLRERLSIEVRAILKAAGTTAILVTHDQHEAFAIADEIGIMNEGRDRAVGHAPTTSTTSRARASSPTSSGRACSCAASSPAARACVTELGELDTGAPLLGAPTARAVDVLLRPDDIVHDDASPWQAEVAAKAFRGAEFLYTLALPSGTRVLSLVPVAPQPRASARGSASGSRSTTWSRFRRQSRVEAVRGSARPRSARGLTAGRHAGAPTARNLTCGARAAIISTQTRGGAVWQLVGLITRRSQVQILPPQPTNQGLSFG